MLSLELTEKDGTHFHEGSAVERSAAKGDPFAISL